MEKERFTILPVPSRIIRFIALPSVVSRGACVRPSHCNLRIAGNEGLALHQGDPQERTLETSMLASKIGYLARGGLVSKTTAVAACC